MKINSLLSFLIVLVVSACNHATLVQKPIMYFSVKIDNPQANTFQMQLKVDGLSRDTVLLKLPQWTPGYYQKMDFVSTLSHLRASNSHGDSLILNKVSDNSWMLTGVGGEAFSVKYDIKAATKFVARSFVDSTHAYIVPTNNFLYVDGFIDNPVVIELDYKNMKEWNDVATGLFPSDIDSDIYSVPNFDILYDSPILIGDLQRLPEFEVGSAIHDFVGYQIGDFDREEFNNNLENVVEAAVSLMGDVPYKKYTFIGIGPGFGGIEHLNNTTISFDGNKIKTETDMKSVMSFIAHEYFHHYNVKRIRPYELGPFNYDEGSRTTQLWISEGLTVYYEYMITRLAGITNEDDLLTSFEEHINHVENNPGRHKQSLVQSSYNTWEDGPFGVEGKTISYYEKGPLVGLILDLRIRHASQNNKSLDDVMRYMYYHYYRDLGRGFTEAEFQMACENIAGELLTDIFEYVHTTKEIDYNSYLKFAGLELDKKLDVKSGKWVYTIHKVQDADALQKEILDSWLRTKS